jgi:hypothetical protein
MNPRVKQVQPANDFTLELLFTNGERKVFDLKPYLDFGVFSELKDPSLFHTVRTLSGSIVWKNGIDICPDTLYLESIKK